MNTIKWLLDTAIYSSPRRPEILIWTILSVLVMGTYLSVTGGPLLGNDSYQYLSIAENFLAGNPAQTSIVHFDVERSWQRIPAPVTTFPAGYPAAVAVIAPLAGSLETAALIVSASALVMLVPLCSWAARIMSLDGLATRFLLFWLLANSWAALFATAAISESLFTFFSTSAVVLFMVASANSASATKHTLLLAVANIMMGLSYWVRYAGLFLFAAMSIFFLLRLWQRRDRASLRSVLCLGISGAIISAGLLRNYLLVGTWKGGNNKIVSHPIMEVLRDFGVSLHHLFLGGHAVARAGIAEIVLFLCIVAVIGILLFRRAAFVENWSRSPQTGWMLMLYIGVYCAAMIYLGTTSVISFDTRMFYPLLPCLLLAAALILAQVSEAMRSKRAVIALAVLLMTGSYLAINIRSYAAAREPALHEVVKLYLSEETEPGVTLSSWIEDNIPKEQTIVANHGQATGYLLRRRTVSLVSREYSDQIWDEQAVKSLMDTYQASFLILYTGNSGTKVLSESPFLSSLAREAPSTWIRLEKRNQDVMIFRAYQ